MAAVGFKRQWVLRWWVLKAQFLTRTMARKAKKKKNREGYYPQKNK